MNRLELKLEVPHLAQLPPPSQRYWKTITIATQMQDIATRRSSLSVQERAWEVRNLLRRLRSTAEVLTSPFLYPIYCSMFDSREEIESATGYLGYWQIVNTARNLIRSSKNTRS